MAADHSSTECSSSMSQIATAFSHDIPHCESDIVCAFLTDWVFASSRHKITMSHSGVSKSQAGQSYLPSSVFRCDVRKWGQIISYLSEEIDPLANNSLLHFESQEALVLALTADSKSVLTRCLPNLALLMIVSLAGFSAISFPIMSLWDETQHKR